MRFDVDASVLTRANTFELLILFYWGLVDRHRVIAEGPEFDDWLRTLPEEISRECSAVVDFSVRLEAQESAHHRAIVTLRPAAGGSVEQLSLRDAVGLSQKPYRILLEDGLSDAAFLMSHMTSSEREYVRRRAADEWVQFENGGGIGGVRRRLEEFLRNRHSQFLVSILVDSDAPGPGQPSSQSSEVLRLSAPMHCYRLLRRAIENYLPMSSLFAWADTVGGTRASNRKTILRAFARMTESQQHHYHMKRGFSSGGSGATRPRLFDGLNAHDARWLRNGFGDTLAALFEDAVSEHDLRANGAWTELRPFVTDLIARMR